MAMKWQIFKIAREIFRIIKQIFRLPITLYRLCRDIYRYFSFPAWSCRGKFKSFNNARHSAPKYHKKHYNGELQYDILLAELQKRKISELEYPMLFWLNMLFAQSSLDKSMPFNVLDFGGGCGVHYFSFANAARTFNTYDLQNLQWQVIDMPNNVNLGNKIVKSLGIPSLHFDTNLMCARTHNVLIASGVLQCVDNVFELLKQYCNGGGATHIIIARLYLQNKVDSFVTLCNAGNAYTPYHIFNEKSFVSFFEGLGYEVFCSWDSSHDKISLPFQGSIRFYSKGFYFRKH